MRLLGLDVQPHPAVWKPRWPAPGPWLTRIRRPEITELARQQGEFLAGLNLLLMAGSPEVQEVGGRFGDAVLGFSRDHLAPFTAQYTAVNAPRASDIAGWERDSAALPVAITDLTTKIGDLNAAFVEQGIEDLR